MKPTIKGIYRGVGGEVLDQSCEVMRLEKSVSSDRKCRVVGVEDNPKLNFS